MLVIVSHDNEESHTWTKAVEMMTPVPNCLRMVRTMLDCTDVKRDSRMGPYTPRDDATRTAKSMPIRMPML